MHSESFLNLCTVCLIPDDYLRFGVDVTRYNRAVYRIFDANYNRAVEGIRVLEDTARMLFDDVDLTSSLKELRHDFTAVIRSDPALQNAMIECRGSERDVLRNGETESEKTRTGIDAIIRANARRAEEAMRVLEEYSKLLPEGSSARFKEIRFRLYDIEHRIILAISKGSVLDLSQRHVLAIFEFNDDIPADRSMIERSIDDGATIIAVSDTVSDDKSFLATAEIFKNLCGTRKVPFFIINRIDCALAVCADGILIDNSGIPLKYITRFIAPSMLVGVVVGDILDDDTANADFVLLRGAISETIKNRKTSHDTKRIPIIVDCAHAKKQSALLLPAVRGVAVWPMTDGSETTVEAKRICSSAAGSSDDAP